MKTFLKHVGSAGLLGLAIASIWPWCVEHFTNKDILFIVFWVFAIPLTFF